MAAMPPPISRLPKVAEAMVSDLRLTTNRAMADATTAAQMPYSKDELIFLGRIFENLTAA